MGLRHLFSPRFILKSLLTLFVLYALQSLYQSFHVTLFSWARYGLQRKTWWGCHFRNYPFLQLTGSHTIMISWETTCWMDDDGLEFGWTAFPMQADEDGAGLTRKQVTSRSGAKREVDVHAENTVGRSGMEYFKVGQGHHLYSVKLENLPADHLIEYFVRLSPNHAPFRSAFPVLPDLTSPTAPPSPPAIHPIKIAIVGDNQSGRDTFTTICRRIQANNPHLIVHLGDMVQHAWKPEEWQKQWFDPIGWYTSLSSRCPMILTLGNHDVWAKGAYRSKYIHPADVPERGEDKHSGVEKMAPVYYHALSIGPIRWVVIDSNVETDAQVAWLEKELSRPATQKSPYKIVLCHISPFIEFWNPQTWHTGESSWPLYVRTRLQPLFEKYRVDLVLSGHQHNYQRGMWKGVNYVTSGGAGGDLDRERVEDYHVYKKTILQHHYMMMSVARGGLSVQVYSLNDRILDTFYIPRSFARKMKPSEMLPQ